VRIHVAIRERADATPWSSHGLWTVDVDGRLVLLFTVVTRIVSREAMSSAKPRITRMRWPAAIAASCDATVA
jgi:hypothetical protein